MTAHNFVDLTGKTFGELTVINQIGKNTYGNILWRCNCSCGNERETTSSELNSGSSSACVSHKPTHCIRGHEFTSENTLWRSTKKGTPYRQCRICKKAQEKALAPKYRLRKRTTKSLWLKKNPKSAARTHKKFWTMSSYGLTLEEYEQKLKAQDNLCGLCGEEFDGVGTKGFAPALDHDHKDGILRDFIHNRCNKAIGQFGDDVKLLELAIDYLKKHQEIKNVPEQN